MSDLPRSALIPSVSGCPQQRRSGCGLLSGRLARVRPPKHAAVRADLDIVGAVLG